MARQMSAQAMALDHQQEVDRQLLTKQISDTFRAFRALARNIKSGQMSQEELTVENECGVALLELLCSNCQDLTRREQTGTLMVGFQRFQALRQQLDSVSAEILADWLQYTEAALLSKPLAPLQLTQQTIDFAENTMVQGQQGGGLRGFMESFLGSKHVVDRTEQYAEDNAEKLRKQNRAAIGSVKSQYRRKQKDGARCPTQNDVYRVSGGAQNKQFGSALYTANSKYKKPRGRQEHKEVMSEDEAEAEGQLVADANVYIAKKLPQKLKRNGRAISLKYPYPCQVQQQLDRDTLGVVLAYPNNDIKAKVPVSHIQSDTNKVSKVEQRHIANYGELGYPSIQDAMFQ